MPEQMTIKPEALEPLFAAWEEPEKHRVKRADGEGAEVRKGRRPSSITIAQNLRAAVKEWRDNFYFGASDTTRSAFLVPNPATVASTRCFLAS